MQIGMQCLPCFVNQVLKTCESVKLDQQTSRRVMKRVLTVLADFESIDGTVLMARQIQQILREETGIADLFYDAKEHANSWMQQVLSGMFNGGLPDSFVEALQLAVAGNIIDLGAIPDLSAEQVNQTLSNVKHAGFAIDHSAEFEKALQKAENILYIGDNAGEIVFDKMLVSMLPKGKVTFATRGKPVLNDITRADAISVGMNDVCKIVDTGIDIPGVVLDKSSDEFLAVWDKADLVIAKGQGNFESLYENCGKKLVFFLFMTKCQRVAKLIDRKIGDYIVLKHGAHNLSI